MGKLGALVKDLESSPLGLGTGEQVFNVPANFAPKALIYARNWSAVRERRILDESVSWYRGGEEHMDELAKKGISLDSLQKTSRVKDVNFYRKAVEPTIFKVQFDLQHYPEGIPIPPHGLCAKNKTTPCKDHAGHFCVDAPYIQIPEGAYDLYCGNFERMHSKNIHVKTKEMEHLIGKGKMLKVWAHDSGYGDKTDFMYVEFIRELIPEPMAVLADDRLYAGMAIEVG